MFYVLYFLLCWMDKSSQNYEVIQCEMKALNLFCENGTRIVINEVDFGPLSDTIKEPNPGLGSSISNLCNFRNVCFVDTKDQNYLNTFPELPRLVNISYNCYHNGYEFIGCYGDNDNRLFKGHSASKTLEMSASICKLICLQYENTYQYFGMENGNECFCGKEDEITKLNESFYQKKPKAQCNAPCASNPKEMCGQYKRISVYKVKKEYDYIGCYYFVDLFTGKSFKAVTMPASICRTFCSEGEDVCQYFGTKDGNTCICAKRSDINKLNTQSYARREDRECSHRCTGDMNSSCGWFLSVYKTSFDPLQRKTVHQRDIPQLSLCSLKMINVKKESHQMSAHCEKGNPYACDQQMEICWSASDAGYSQSKDNSLTKYVKINYSCTDKKRTLASEKETIEGDDLNDLHLLRKSREEGLVIGGVIAVCFVGAMLIGLLIAKRKQLKKKRRDELEQGTNKKTSPYTGEHGNVVDSEDGNSDYKSSERENSYRVVFKNKQSSKNSKQKINTSSSPDDVYVDATEGVYDVSNKPRDKIRNAVQPIYSHTAEDVYDSTVTNDQIKKEEENVYDQGFHRPTGNDYEFSDS